MSNTTTKKKIKGYDCTVNWFCVGKYDTLTITIEFDKVLGSTTDRKYVEKLLGIESTGEKHGESLYDLKNNPSTKRKCAENSGILQIS